MSGEIKNLVIRSVLHQKIPEIGVLPEIPNPHKLGEKTQKIKLEKIWGPTWFVKFKLKISSFPSKSKEMANILHFSTGFECCEKGSRIPAVFLRWDKKMVVFTYIDGEGTKEIVVDQTLQLNTLISVTIMQSEDVSLPNITGFIVLATCIYRISLSTSMEREPPVSDTQYPTLTNMKKLTFLPVNINVRPGASLDRKI